MSFRRCLSSKILSIEYETSHIRSLGTFKPLECSLGLNTVFNRRPNHCHFRLGTGFLDSGIDSVVSRELCKVRHVHSDSTRPRDGGHTSVQPLYRKRYNMHHLLILTKPRNYLQYNPNQHFHGKSTMISHARNFSSESDESDNRVKVKPVFVAVPNPIRAIRNFVYSWLIRGYFDKDFSMAEFTEGAKQAMSVVSQKISEGNFEGLVGLLSPKTIDEIKATYKTLGVNERGSLGIELEDILHVVPYNVAVHYDNAGGKFLNILMRYWCLSLNAGSENDPGVIGFKVGQPPPGMSEEQFKNMGKVFTCTFEFHRDVSSDDDPTWTITQVTLGKLLNTSSDGFPGEELE